VRGPNSGLTADLRNLRACRRRFMLPRSQGSKRPEELPGELDGSSGEPPALTYALKTRPAGPRCGGRSARRRRPVGAEELERLGRGGASGMGRILRKRRRYDG
jgi:hypothetical protein